MENFPLKISFVYFITNHFSPHSCMKSIFWLRLLFMLTPPALLKNTSCK